MIIEYIRQCCQKSNKTVNLKEETHSKKVNCQSNLRNQSNWLNQSQYKK